VCLNAILSFVLRNRAWNINFILFFPRLRLKWKNVVVVILCHFSSLSFSPCPVLIDVFVGFFNASKTSMIKWFLHARNNHVTERRMYHVLFRTQIFLRVIIRV
jgi:hypothetical protein